MAELPPPDMSDEQVHHIIQTHFTDRYIKRTGSLGEVLHSLPYDARNPLCDYTRTSWEARPNKFSAPVGRTILAKLHGIKASEVDSGFIVPFANRADQLVEELKDYPLMLINGHHMDLQAGVSLFAAGRGISQSAQTGGSTQSYHDMVKLSHGVVTRGVAPVMIGRRHFHPGNLSLFRLGQLITNIHGSFPSTRQMHSAGIPEEYIAAYNDRLQDGVLQAVQAQSQHPLGLHTLWTMSPGGEPDEKVIGEKRKDYEEPAVSYITKIVKPGTIRLIQQMGVGLVPVYTKFGRGKSPTVMELGATIPPDAVTASRVHDVMTRLAIFRSDHGQPTTYEGASES